jgi:hypothetical protein
MLVILVRDAYAADAITSPTPGFDPNDWAPWYSPDEIKIAVPVLPDINTGIQSPTQQLWGQISEAGFEAYKWLVHGILTVVGSIIFGLLFVTWLLEPALRLGDELQRTLIGPFELWKVAAALAGMYLGWAWYVEHNPGGAIMDASFTAIAFAVMVLIVPATTVRYLVSFAASSSTVVLMAGSGQNPSSIPGPSTTSIDTERLKHAYNTYVGNMERILIAKPAEGLTFGGKGLPDGCQAAYANGRALHLPPNEMQNFTGPDDHAHGPYLTDVDQCKPYVEKALKPTAKRAILSWLLAVSGLVFVLAIGWIAWPALAGMLRLMAAAALYKFMFMRAMLPGEYRAGGIRALFNTAIGAIALVFVATVLSLISIFMEAVWNASRGTNMAWRLLCVFAIPIAFLFGARKTMKATRNRAERAARNSSGTTHTRTTRAPAAVRDPLQQQSTRYVRNVATGVVAGRVLRKRSHSRSRSSGPDRNDQTGKDSGRRPDQHTNGNGNGNGRPSRPGGTPPPTAPKTTTTTTAPRTSPAGATGPSGGRYGTVSVSVRNGAAAGATAAVASTGVGAPAAATGATVTGSTRAQPSKGASSPAQQAAARAAARPPTPNPKPAAPPARPTPPKITGVTPKRRPSRPAPPE